MAASEPRYLQILHVLPGRARLRMPSLRDEGETAPGLPHLHDVREGRPRRAGRVTAQRRSVRRGLVGPERSEETRANKTMTWPHFSRDVVP